VLVEWSIERWTDRSRITPEVADALGDPEISVFATRHRWISAGRLEVEMLPVWRNLTAYVPGFKIGNSWNGRAPTAGGIPRQVNLRRNREARIHVEHDGVRPVV
jgi:hypothetical protein